MLASKYSILETARLISEAKAGTQVVTAGMTISLVRGVEVMVKQESRDLKDAVVRAWIAVPILQLLEKNLAAFGSYDIWRV